MNIPINDSNSGLQNEKDNLNTSVEIETGNTGYMQQDASDGKADDSMVKPCEQNTEETIKKLQAEITRLNGIIAENEKTINDYKSKTEAHGDLEKKENELEGARNSLEIARNVLEEDKNKLKEKNAVINENVETISKIAEEIKEQFRKIADLNEKTRNNIVNISTGIDSVFYKSSYRDIVNLYLRMSYHVINECAGYESIKDYLNDISDFFESMGFEKINPEINKIKFNPSKHQRNERTDGNIITEVIVPGWEINGDVLLRATVKTSSANTQITEDNLQ